MKPWFTLSDCWIDLGWDAIHTVTRLKVQALITQGSTVRVDPHPVGVPSHVLSADPFQAGFNKLAHDEGPLLGLSLFYFENYGSSIAHI